MGIVQEAAAFVGSLTAVQLAGAFAALVLAFHVVPYILDPHGLRKYPAAGPFGIAAFTDAWVVWQARRGKRFEALDKAHRKYGKYVRISPRQVSIADPKALDTIYGHGTGTMKPAFYDAFVGLKNVRGLFNTRDRAEHTRKRKIVSATFAQRNVLEFEPYIASVMRQLLNKWDAMCDKAVKDGKGWVTLDTLTWLNFLAFDIIGDLAFGAPFGMVEREADICEIEQEDGSIKHLPAVTILNERGEYSNCLGVMPPHWRPFAKYVDPWFSRGHASVINLAGMARARVNARLKSGAGDRKDLLARLQEARDESGNPMDIDELTAEALTQLIAGSDTTSNSSCAIIFYLARNQDAQKKLQAELDKTFKDRGISGVMEYEDIKTLPYLEACINEALRMHSTSSMGLPRVMPAQGADFQGEHFKEGTEVSVPAYTIHHLESIWGDPFNYRPERWLGSDAKQLEKSFIPFSIGPRSCVGRNLATMELLVFMSTLFYRYDFKLADENQTKLETSEGFLRKPLESWIKMRRRSIDA
ncbi:isobutene-forming enzyme and benzoate 4-hydroxylase [Cystobasidium minutum MCA 4210]|uniref:isobutene-forming enzyme and benzoate 4-hydroxylase n=1 Tax=Cystobasidium minutum MCA 4210 TaxID=1397322 RepID=UPI0034D00726|eukprot:jgi/Rhomi1/204915/MIX5744_1871_32